MTLELFEKLEELVSFYILEVQKLKAENNQLRENLIILTDEVNDHRSRKRDFQLELDQHESLKRAHQKMKTDRERVRGMVHGILNDLEKIHII